MWEPVVSGFLFGGLLAIMIGPVFFTLIQTSIHRGFYSGVLMAVGISLSDLIYVSLIYFGLSYVPDRNALEVALGVAGGAVMIVFGLNLMRKRGQRAAPVAVPLSGPQGVRQVLKGLALNGINPFVLIFWLGVVSMLTLRAHYTAAHHVAFLVSMLGTVFGSDMLKAYAANRLSSLITATLLTWLNRLAGAGLVFFGLKLLYHAYAQAF